MLSFSLTFLFAFTFLAIQTSVSGQHLFQIKAGTKNKWKHLTFFLAPRQLPLMNASPEAIEMARFHLRLAPKFLTYKSNVVFEKLVLLLFYD